METEVFATYQGLRKTEQLGERVLSYSISSTLSPSPIPHPCPVSPSPRIPTYLHTDFWLPVKHPYQLDMGLLNVLVLSLS